MERTTPINMVAFEMPGYPRNGGPRPTLQRAEPRRVGLGPPLCLLSPTIPYFDGGFYHRSSLSPGSFSAAWRAFSPPRERASLGDVRQIVGHAVAERVEAGHDRRVGGQGQGLRRQAGGKPDAALGHGVEHRGQAFATAGETDVTGSGGVKSDQKHMCRGAGPHPASARIAISKVRICRLTAEAYHLRWCDSSSRARSSFSANPRELRPGKPNPLSLPLSIAVKTILRYTSEWS